MTPNMPSSGRVDVLSSIRQHGCVLSPTECDLLLDLVNAAERVCSTWPTTAKVLGLRTALAALTEPQS